MSKKGMLLSLIEQNRIRLDGEIDKKRFTRLSNCDNYEKIIAISEELDRLILEYLTADESLRQSEHKGR